MTFSISNATVLLNNELIDTGLQIDNGSISALIGDGLDASGYYVLPGIIDLHGDGFDRQIFPRPKAGFDQRRALRQIDLELASCGVTTAWLAHSWSWEGMKRSPKQAQHFAQTLQGYKPKSRTDLRLQIRLETHTCDMYDALIEAIDQFGIDYLVFNNHLPEAKEMVDRNDGSFQAWAAEIGRNADEHFDAFQMALSQEKDVPEFLEKSARAFDQRGIRYGSHDDPDEQTRKAFSDLGAHIAEFPTTVAAARTAHDLGNPVLMGAPNVVRGGSQSGNIAAIDLIRMGLCDVLVSDYYYPALSQSAIKLWQDGECSLSHAWKMISTNAADVMGLDTLGRIDKGMRADLVFLNKETLEIDATLCRGQFSFVTGQIADRLMQYAQRNAQIAAQ